MKVVILAVAGCAVLPFGLQAQSAVSLPAVNIYSPRVANQTPAGTFAMPVSALRYEPRVDIHARNLAEGQADVTLRGGIFENTGFAVAGMTLLDPQTGHYFAELPVAPALLLAPEVVTGADLPLAAGQATVGAVSYDWRRIRNAGAASVAAGENALWRADFYQGQVFSSPAAGAASYGVDVAVAHSESDGTVPFGEHEFDRVNARLQRIGAASQTDLFAGYQAKRFGWPNLYTPFNSNETENLQTVLFAGSHRAELGAGGFFRVGAFHRRNKDDYAFNRFAPLGPVHPFQHTTWVTGANLQGRHEIEGLWLNYRAEALADELRSTALTFGRYRTRTFTQLAIVPEKIWSHSGGDRTAVKLGATYDDTNRGGGALSPVLEISRERAASALRRVYFSYTQTTQVPTYTALNSNPAAGLFRGNPNLGRQRSRNVEFGARGTFAGWTAEGALFWRRDAALVDWTYRRGVIARTANAVDIDVAGLELVARRSWGAADFVFGYTALTKDADYRGASVDASFYALNYARHRLTAAATLRLGHGFELRVDNVARIQKENELRVIGGNEALTTSAALAFRPQAWRGLELAVQVDNAWDADFQEVPAVPAARRQWSAGASYAW
jgi:vitamin B12 transporter